MAIRQTKKISDLPALSPASLDTTFVVGISGSTTYKISINQLTSSLDTTFATDLVTATLSSSLDGKLSTSSFNQYTASISTASLVTLITNLNSYTASQDGTNIAFTNGINSRLTTSSFNSYTASFTASVASGTISGSSQLTSSFDTRYVVSGSITQTTWDNIANKPSGIVSQSTDLSSLNTFTASISTASLVNRLNAIESVSGSWITESETGSFLTSLNGAISSSTQISDLGFVTGSYTTINSFNSLTQSFNSISQSFTTISGSVGGVDFNGIVSSSAQITAFGFVSGSYLTSLSGAISSSSQVIGILSSLNSVSASLISKTGSYATTGSNTFYGDQIFIGNVLTQSVELSVGETYGGGKVFKVLSGSYALIVDMNDLGSAQGQYMQIATNATSTTGSVNQSLILARSGSVPNDYNFLLPGNAAHQLGGQYYGLDMEDPAVMAYSSSVGGYNDWYIPSTTEIAWINQGVAGRLYEGFSQANYYWTSNYGGATYVVSDGAGRTTNGAADSTQRPVVAIRKINRSYREVYGNANIILSGSLNVSGSITGSTNFDTIVNKPTLISGSAQITSLGFVSGSLQTSITLLNSFTSSLNIWTSSVATTGSNQFNGNQTITGSLVHGNAGNIATGEKSHAEGEGTQAIGNFSHAEGLGTIAYGNYSHAEGQDTITSGSHSHTEGNQTIALADHQHVQGQYNITSSVPAAFIVGNGTDAENRSNLIHAAGNEVQITGSLIVSGSITGSTNFNTIVNKPTLISGSSQLTSSFDTRYAISASFVSSSNLSSIRTITSASYAALTPVSGTLYIIIG